METTREELRQMALRAGTQYGVVMSVFPNVYEDNELNDWLRGREHEVFFNAWGLEFGFNATQAEAAMFKLLFSHRDEFMMVDTGSV